MLGRAAQRLVRMSSKRILLTGLSTYWGGRLAQALERDPAVEAIIGVDRRPPKVELQRTEYVRVTDSHSLIRRDRRGGRDRHRGRHAARGRLDRHQPAPGPREQRHGHDERAGRVRGRGQPGAQGRLQVQRPLLRRRAGRPRASSPRRWTARTRRARRSSATSSTPSAPCASSRCATRTSRSPCCASPTASAPALRTSLSQLFGLPAVPGHPGLRPALSVHPRGRPRRAASSTRCATTSRASTTAPPTACSSSARSPGCWASRWRPCCRPWGRRWRRAPCAAPACASRRRPLGLLRYGRGLDNRKLKATGYRYRYTSREAVIKLREHQRLAAILGDAQEAYRYERDLEEFLRRSPSVRPTARRPDAGPVEPRSRASAAAPASRQGSGGLRRPRRRGAHRSAALAGARGAGRARRPTSARTPRGRRS